MWGEKMQRILNHIPWRLKTAIIKYLLRKWKVDYIGVPSFKGYWPKMDNIGRITIGEKCLFRSFRLRQYFTVGKNASLEIGDHTFINDGANICVTRSVKIGSHVMIADMAYIFDTDFHEISPDLPVKCEPIVIGNNVWIGANVMILPGSVIGDHSVIAAGSIVTGEIPAKCLAAGAPARSIKSLDIPDGWVRK